MFKKLSYWVCSRLFRKEVEQINAAVNILRAAHFSHNKNTVPNIAILSLVSAEDRRFWSHSGFDYRAMTRAALHYLISGRVSGGSTIDQQFVRTITGHYERTLFRKFREIMLAISLQCLATKSEIAAMYLLIAYFGWQMNGIVQACRRFKISLENMSMRQAAFVIASLKYPIARVPTSEFNARHHRRVDYILANMKAINSDE